MIVELVFLLSLLRFSSLTITSSSVIFSVFNKRAELPRLLLSLFLSTIGNISVVNFFHI